MTDLSTPINDDQSEQTAKSLITKHIDIWTTAIERKSSAGRGTSNKFSLYGIKKLRELILELAVRGKLVPQDENDEPASVLLERIAAEKAQLVKENKTKKPKALQESSEDEQLSELPDGWERSNLNDLGQFQKGYAFKSKDYLDSGFMITKIQTLTDNHIQNAVYIDPKIADKFKQYLIVEGDIVMTTVGSWFSAPNSAVGRSFLINKQFDNSLLNQNAVRIRPYKGLNPMYLYLCINSSTFKNYLVKVAQGTANQASITQASIKSFEILLPPEEEQHRIVAKVDELMSLCDALEAQTEASISAHQTLVETLLNALLLPNTTQPADSQSASLEPALNDSFIDSWQRVAEHFDTLFTTEASIDTLKQTILQLAVMGKLVEQDENDEPAAKLLERIAAEKAQLIKDGKIKKQKPLPAITDEEKPFELPQGWEWARLSQTGLGSTGKTPSTKQPIFFEGKIPFIGPGEITPVGNILKSDKFLSQSGLEHSSEAYPGDIFMVCIGGSIGKAAIVVERSCFNQQINCISPLFIESSYLYFALSTDSFYSSVLEKATGSATPIINRGKWEELLVPIAPLEEQHRIVTRVDELMALCDQLKARLSDAQTTQLHLTDAIVEQAI